MLRISNIVSAETVEHALELMQQYPEAQILAAGTDLTVKIRSLTEEESITLIDISRIKTLKEIIVSEDELRIGALVTHRMIEDHTLIQEEYTALATACSQIGSLQIRNTATIGGNLCNASPAADSAPALAVFDAQVELQTADGCKRMPLSQFMELRWKKDVSVRGILTAIILPRSQTRSAFEKIGGRNALIISTASCAVAVGKTGYRVAFGSVNPWVTRQPEIEAYLDQLTDKTTGGRMTDAQVVALEALLAQHLHPISDVRASAEYRLAVAGGLLRSVLEKMA